MSKPTVTIECEEDKNIFRILALVSRTLKRLGNRAEDKEMRHKVFMSGSYRDAKKIIREYVNLVIPNEEEE